MVMLESTPHARVMLMGRRGAKKTQRQQPQPRSARPKTQYVYNDSPEHPARTERVEKVVDTLEAMWRRGQLTDHQFRAGRIFSSAWDVLGSSVGGTMDFDRLRGPSVGGNPPAPPFMRAAEIVRGAKFFLYGKDWNIIRLIVGYGNSLQETADILSIHLRTDKEDVGRCFRQALNEMADRWLGTHGPKESGRIRSQRNFEPGETVVTTGELKPSAVAHVSRSGVKMSGE